jgi:hypothetical protein
VHESGFDIQDQANMAQETPAGATSVTSGFASGASQPDLMPLNFTKAISLSAIFHPSHESQASRQSTSTEDRSPGFLLVMASVQDRLGKACKALHLTIEQVQVLYVFVPFLSGQRPRNERCCFPP